MFVNIYFMEVSSDTEKMIEAKMDKIQEKAEKEFDKFLSKNGLELVMGVIREKKEKEKEED